MLLRLSGELACRNLTIKPFSKSLYLSNSNTILSFQSRLFKTSLSNLRKYVKPEKSKEIKKPEKQDIKYYLQTSSSCVFYTGAVIFVVFLSSCITLSFQGFTQNLLKKLDEFDKKTVNLNILEHGRKYASSASNSICKYTPLKPTPETIENITSGYILYFCLKPLRYPLWFYMIRRCIKNKQMKGLLPSKELSQKHRNYAMHRARETRDNTKQFIRNKGHVTRAKFQLRNSRFDNIKSKFKQSRVMKKGSGLKDRINSRRKRK